MSEHDFTVSSVGIPQVGKINKKPCYLITLNGEPTTTKKNPNGCMARFIAIDRPDPQNGLVSIKGFFCEQSEEEIVDQFLDIVANFPKESILDLMIPIHRVHCIRSLVFNANKAVTQVRQER